MKLRCQNMCAIESLLKSREHVATTLESESRRRERPRSHTVTEFSEPFHFPAIRLMCVMITEACDYFLMNLCKENFYFQIYVLSVEMS